MSKLEGLPTIHYISLKESEERRANLAAWFDKFEISNYVPHIFERFEKYNHVLTGKNVHLLHHNSKGPITSHFTLLKEWYQNNNDSVLFVAEDDLSFETVNYWNFSWREFIDCLPSDWNCVQLVVIRESPCQEYYLEKRKERDWCAAAYIMKREYVRLLLDLYYPQDEFVLNVEGIDYYPTVEHLLFTNKPGVYSFPLFVEDCYHTQSTLQTAEEKFKHAELSNGQGEYHHASYDCALNWWARKGCELKATELSGDPFNFAYLKRKYSMNISGVIHVGAHYGQEIPDYLQAGAEKIVLFEPVRETFEILKERVEKYQANFELHNVALGSSDNVVTMFISNNEGQSSSILPPKEHLTYHPHVEFQGLQEVRVTTLDQFNYKDCNYLHMDVQGYELEVLKGSKETLKGVDYVYCEVNRGEVYEGNAYVEEIDSFLKVYGLDRVETCWMGGIWGDALYIRGSSYNVSPSCQIAGLDDIYKQQFGYPSQGFFVELGAFDGESYSNTSCLADHGWQGIYIEPVSEYCAQCRERHKNNQVSVIECCVGSKEGEVELHVSGPLTTTNKSLQSMYSEIEWSKDFKFSSRKSLQVRLETLLKSLQVRPGFEVLVVDVEGSEGDVFDSFDLDYWLPQMLIVELIEDHESFQKYEKYVENNRQVRQKILQCGYKEIYRDSINTIFISKERVGP